MTTCVSMSALRLYRYRAYSKDHRGGGDSLSQREMIITSPSDHSSVSCAVNYITGDESRLVDHEVTSPVDEVRKVGRETRPGTDRRTH